MRSALTLQRFAGLAIAVFALALTGCDMVDSQIQQQMQEYFPNAELLHPQPNALLIKTNVGGVTEKFVEQVIATMIRDHCCHGLQGMTQDLDSVLPIAGITNLTVNFNTAGCGWDPNRPRVLGCVTFPQSENQMHLYSIYDQVTLPVIQMPYRRR